METKLNVLTAATQLQTLLLQHRTASRQIECLDDHMGKLGRQMLRAEMGGRDRDTLHLALRVSTAEGVVGMYRVYRDRAWARVQQLSQAVIQGMGDRGDSPMEVDSESGRAVGVLGDDGLHSTLESSYGDMSTPYTMDSTMDIVSDLTAGQRGQSSMGEYQSETMSTERSTHQHIHGTRPVWEEPAQSMPAQSRPRSDKAATRWTNATRESYRAS